MFLPPLPRPSPQLTKQNYSPPPRSRNASLDPKLSLHADYEPVTRSPLQRFWKVRGLHCRISSQIDPKYYYKDTSLSSVLKHQGRIEKQLQRYQLLKQKYDSILTDRKRKRDVLKEMKTKYDVKFSKKEVAESSTAQLALAALSIVNEKQKHSAATTIARAWKSAQIRKSMALHGVRQKSAARAIQRAWRAHLTRKQQRAVLEARNSAATAVQRVWRGHSVRKATKELMNEARMKKNFLYFERIRTKLLADSAKIIWKHWTAYKVRLTQAHLDLKRGVKRTKEAVSEGKDCCEPKCCESATPSNIGASSTDHKRQPNPRKDRPSIAPERKSNDKFQGSKSPPVSSGKSSVLRKSRE